MSTAPSSVGVCVSQESRYPGVSVSGVQMSECPVSNVQVSGGLVLKPPPIPCPLHNWQIAQCLNVAPKRVLSYVI